MKRKITRRNALALGGAALGSALVAACGGGGLGSAGGGSTKKNPVNVRMFVFLGGNLGVMPKAFAKEYMAAHPNVTIDIYEDSNLVGYPKMVAAKRTTPDQPFVNLGFFNAQTSVQGDTDDMWNALDYSAMSNAKDIAPALRRDNKKGIGIGADQVGILYNPTAISSAPTSWADVWDPKYAGKLSLFDYWWYVVFAAAKLNGGGLTNMDPGWSLWRAHAKQVRALVSSNPQWQDILSNGTSTITSCFNGTGLQFKKNGAPVAYSVPKEGAIPIPVYMQSVKGNTKDQEAVCQDIINEMISPKWCAQWAETSIEAPANVKSQLSAELAALPAFSKSTIEKLLPIDWSVTAKNNTEWRQKWDQNIKANI